MERLYRRHRTISSLPLQLTREQCTNVIHGNWYISVVSAFPNTFALDLDSNLHDLNGTNPDWRCFHEYIKVLGMTWNFTENIFGIYKKYWRKNQDQGAHTLSTREGACLPPGRAPWLVDPLELHRPQLQLYIFTFREKKIKRRVHRVLRYRAAAMP